MPRANGQVMLMIIQHGSLNAQLNQVHCSCSRWQDLPNACTCLCLLGRASLLSLLEMSWYLCLCSVLYTVREGVATPSNGCVTRCLGRRSCALQISTCRKRLWREYDNIL
jgi:hypothetical protein